MYILLLDQNQEEIDRFSIEKKYNLDTLRKVDNPILVDEKSRNFLNNMDFPVVVYSPMANSDDYYISFMNKTSMNGQLFSFDESSNYYGIPISDIFVSDNNDFIKKMNDIYDNNQSEYIIGEFYIDNILYKRFNIKSSRVNNFISLMILDITDYVVLSSKERELFENDITPIFIIQDGYYVKCNNKFIELYGFNGNNEVIGNKIGFSGLSDESTVELLSNNANRTIDEKLSSLKFNLTLRNEDGTILNFSQYHYKYITYKNKPAVLCIINDITKQELNRIENESVTRHNTFLKENLDLIQSTTNTGLTYKFNDEVIHSSKLYEIIEREPYNDDPYKDIIYEYIIDEDKHILEDNYAKLNSVDNINFTIRIKTAKGNLKYIECYMKLKFDNSAHYEFISFYKDVSDEKLYLKELKETLDKSKRIENNFIKIQGISKTTMAYSEDMELNDIEWYTEGYSFLGIDSKDYEGNMFDFILEGDNITKSAHDSCTPENPEVSYIQRGITKNNKIIYVKCFVSYEFDDNGNKKSFTSLFQDITEDIERENNLKKVVKDKELLLTEVHHRVKNNLQIIISLINLNRNYESNPDTILDDTENRIYTMALIHEKIYGSDSLSDVNMKDYIESLVNSLLDTYWSDIEFHSNIDPINLDMDNSIPIGLILNELVTNTIKYAFPKEEGNLYVEFRKDNKHYTLIVKDDGIGLPDNFNLESLDNLGLTVVQNLTIQLSGTITLIDCEGTGFKIEFDELE